MTEICLLDWPMAGLVIKVATNVDDNEKALNKAVLAGRLDAVYLPHVSLASLRKLERLGFPYALLSGTRVWRSANISTHDAIPGASVAWSATGGEWKGVEESVYSELRVPPAAAHQASCTFFNVDGQALLKCGADGKRIDVTQGPVSTLGLAGLRSEFEQLVSLDHEIHVPNGQFEVERILAHMGYIPGKPLQPVLLSPMLSYSVTAPIVRDFTVTTDDVDRFGEQSGDRNPLHFDTDFAKSQGFEGRLAHGMIFNGWLTKLLGMEYPGPGTIFARNSTVYIAPMYPDRTYAVRISTTSVNASNGAYRILAQLVAGDGKIATLSYNDVLKRPSLGKTH